MDWWQILLAGVPSLFSGILLYEWKQQRKRIKDQEDEKEVRNEAFVKGVQALLRDRLITGMETCLEKGYAPINTVEIMGSMYAAYCDLGGNGIVSGIYKRFSSLPHKLPDDV